jgi:hypothetical protein
MFAIQFYRSILQGIKAFGQLIILFILLSSCSPEARLHHLLSRHPELSVIDSIHTRDTVIIHGLKLDTSFVFSTKIDSVVLQKERLHLVFQKVHDTVVIHAALEQDTVYINRILPVSKIKVVKESFLTSFKSMLPWLVIALITLTVLAVFLHSWFK